MTTTYERFAKSSDENRRLLLQEKLILRVTEELCRAMAESGVSRSDLAERMGKSKGHISRLLAGDRNLTLRTVADIADSLRWVIRVSVEPVPVLKDANEPKILKIPDWSTAVQKIRPRITSGTKMDESGILAWGAAA